MVKRKVKRNGARTMENKPVENKPIDSKSVESTPVLPAAAEDIESAVTEVSQDASAMYEEMDNVLERNIQRYQLVKAVHHNFIASCEDEVNPLTFYCDIPGAEEEPIRISLALPELPEEAQEILTKLIHDKLWTLFMSSLSSINEASDRLIAISQAAVEEEE